MKSIESKIKTLKKFFNYNETFIVREFQSFGRKMALCYFEEFVKFPEVSHAILEPLVSAKGTFSSNNFNKFILEKILFATDASEIENFSDIKNAIMDGFVVMIVDGEEGAIKINAINTYKRAVAEPPTSNVIRGPREGFIEDININISLIKKRLKTEKLKIENFIVGKYTRTKVALLYLNGIASKKVVNEIRKIVKEIEIDGIIDSYYIQTYLYKRPGSIFKQCGTCEKPDVAVAKILEGRVGIVVDGSPTVLTLPFLLVEDLQNSEDYYENHTKVSFVRILRLIGIFLAIIMPGLYISFQVFHYEALPLKFLVSILSSAQSVPLTPTMEMLFIFLMFEILFEASVRIPKGLGNSLNIIGALILGDTAVKSGLASAPTIMIVAMSSIALYLLPDETNVMRIIRVGFIIAGAVLGIVGIGAALVFLFAYLCDFDSYEAAYLAPFAPYIEDDMKDAVLKQHLKEMKKRPKSFDVNKRKRWEYKICKRKTNDLLGNHNYDFNACDNRAFDYFFGGRQRWLDKLYNCSFCSNYWNLFHFKNNSKQQRKVV